MGPVIIGSTFVDIKGYPHGKYHPSGKNAGRVEFIHGGVCRNIAEDLANLELSPTFVSLVDETSVGTDVLTRLDQHGVRTDYIRRIKGGMGTWLAVFDSHNDVYAAISSRPDLSPILDILLEQGEEIIAGADSVLLEIDINPEIVEEIVRLCGKHGKQIYAAVSNMTIAMERREALRQVSCFVCNRSEAELLFSDTFEGEDPDDLAHQLSAAVQAASIPSMVMTLGADGAVWADQEGNSGHCAAWEVPVADTTGAGDAFFAGVAAGLTYGKTLAEACEIGTRLAASVVCTRENTCSNFLPQEFGLRKR